jgi:hypothetical protein
MRPHQHAPHDKSPRIILFASQLSVGVVSHPFADRLWKNNSRYVARGNFSAHGINPLDKPL